MSVYIPVELQRSIREQFRDRCAYCQTAEFLTATTFEFEHIQPLVAAGITVFENLCLACPSCNRYKGSRQRVTTETGEEVMLFHPQRQVWTEHFIWSEDGVEIQDLSLIGKVTIDTLRMNRPALVRVRKMWVKLNEHPPKSKSLPFPNA